MKSAITLHPEDLEGVQEITCNAGNIRDNVKDILVPVVIISISLTLPLILPG